MTLADALRLVAPPAAARSDEELGVRQTALEVIYGELHRLARLKCADRAEAEDVASGLACSIAAAGPRDPATAPPTDAQARDYLSTAVRNRLIDRYRAGHRVTGDEELDRFAGASGPDVDLDAGSRTALLREAEGVLYEQAVPAIAHDGGQRFDRDGFLAAIDQMRAINREELTIERLLMAADGEVTSAGRNRIYKQHERARSRLLAALPRWLESQTLTPPVSTAVRRLAAFELAARVSRGGTS